MKAEDKRNKFAVEYMRNGLNATRAAIFAGYSSKTADQAGSRLLKDVKVQSKIVEIQKRAEEKAIIEVSDVLKELKKIGLSDIRNFYNSEGGLKNISELNAEDAAALSGVECDELFEGAGQDREQVGETKKIRLWDKLRALELMGKYLKMFGDNINLPSDGKLSITWEK